MRFTTSTFLGRELTLVSDWNTLFFVALTAMMLLSRTFLRVVGVHRRNVIRHKEIGVGVARAQLLSSSQSRNIRCLGRIITASGSHDSGSNYSTSTVEKLKSISTEGTMTSTEKKPFRRLPTEIRPYHYEISLTPDLKHLSFEGTEDIHIEVRRPVLVITARFIFSGYEIFPFYDSCLVAARLTTGC